MSGAATDRINAIYYELKDKYESHEQSHLHSEPLTPIDFEILAIKRYLDELARRVA